MIKLKVEPYCQSCAHFSPRAVVQECSTLADGIHRKFETAVVCKHSSACAAMVDYLKGDGKSCT